MFNGAAIPKKSTRGSSECHECCKRAALNEPPTYHVKCQKQMEKVLSDDEQRTLSTLLEKLVSGI